MSSSKRLALVAALAVVIGVACTIVYYYGFVVVETHHIPLQVNIVEEGAGINVETDSLDFGKIPLGAGGRKEFTVSNTYDFPIMAKFTINGPTASAIRFEPAQPVIEPHTNQSIRTLFDSRPLTLGEYSDTIVVTLTRS